jgi:hypothetical protein
MVRFVKPVGFFAVVSLLGAVAVSSLGNDAHARERCRRVHGATNSLFVTENCTSPVGLCTSGKITGGGSLDGAYVFLAFDAAPSAGLPSVEPAANLSYSGNVTITARRGEMVAHDLGVLDAVNGYFTEVERPVSGTGIFANPANDFFISGAVNAAGNGFSGELSGTLCTDGDFDNGE